jgi:protein TonB
MNAPSSGKIHTLAYLGLSLSLCFALAACSDKEKDKTDVAADSVTQKQKITTSVDRLMQWPEKDLRAKARQAVIEQRWYKPTGNSALEYYLALKRKLATPDESVDTALADILPYAVIGMDQAVTNFDDREALRLEGLIRMADPGAPALARVKSDLEKMKIRQAQAEADKASAEQLAAENEAKAKEDAAKAKEAAAKKAKEAADREDLQTTSTIPAPAPQQIVQAPPTLAQQAPAPVQQAPAQVAPAPAAKSAPVAIKTPAPPYPPSALAAGTKGEVVAEIVISGTGDVIGVNIISSSPRKVFDSTVQSTVRRWKFRGNGETTTIRRTFQFN